MRENPYQGINAHLNSMLQTPGNDQQTAIWPAFHGQHIFHIVDALNLQFSGRYIAYGEQSLQTRGFDYGGGIELHRPVPDVSIYQRSIIGETLTATALAPTWEASVAEVFELVPQPRAVVIRETAVQGKLGRVVTRIELLSPSNKQGGGNYESYVVKRAEAVETGVPLIEIDYLHEAPPLITKLPVYPEHPEAYPYWIIVTDPRPNWSKGRAKGYGFGVNEQIKSIPIPLADDEGIVFDLNALYQHTFQAGLWGTLIDYSQEPERFETYSADDQEIIRKVAANVTTRND